MKKKRTEVDMGAILLFRTFSYQEVLSIILHMSPTWDPENGDDVESAERCPREVCKELRIIK